MSGSRKLFSGALWSAIKPPDDRTRRVFDIGVEIDGEWYGGVMEDHGDSISVYYWDWQKTAPIGSGDADRIAETLLRELAIEHLDDAPKDPLAPIGACEARLNKWFERWWRKLTRTN